MLLSCRGVSTACFLADAWHAAGANTIGTLNSCARRAKMDTQLDRHCIEVLHSKLAKGFLRKIVAFSEDRSFGRMSTTILTEYSRMANKYQRVTNALITK